MNSITRFLVLAALAVSVITSGCGSRPQPQESAANNANASTPSKIQSTLSIEAGLVYKSGDAKPVPRTEFHLLDADPEKILTDAKIERRGRLKNWKEMALVKAYAAAELCVHMLTRCPALKDSWDLVRDADNALKPHITKSVTTGFDGKASFEAVPAGTYYVMGVYLLDDSFVVWSVEVSLESESKQVILDQNNASMIFQPS